MAECYCLHQMPLLDHNKLQGHRQWRLAYTFLTFIGNGYVWQEEDDGLIKVTVSICGVLVFIL